MGDWTSANLRSAASELASSGMRRAKNATVYRVDLALIIAKGLATYLRFIEYIICVLSTQVSFFNFSLKLSFNLSDVMFSPETL